MNNYGGIKEEAKRKHGDQLEDYYKNLNERWLYPQWDHRVEMMRNEWIEGIIWRCNLCLAEGLGVGHEEGEIRNDF